MSDSQSSRSDLPIVPALVISSLLGGLIALGASSLWRFAFPAAMNAPEPNVTATSTARLAPVESVEFLPPLTSQEQRIEAALEKPTECDFTDTPLTDVVQFFSEYASIKIVIDVESLSTEGIASDTPVTKKLGPLRLRSLLPLVLEPLQLTAIPKHDVLLVTTLSKAIEHPVTRTYPVSDLCRVSGSNVLDFENLILLLEQETSGPWHDIVGNGGKVTELASTGSLSIWQSYQVHREILELLRSLRAAQKSNLLNASKSELQKWDDQRATAAASLLKRPTAPVEFVEVIGTTQNDAERRIEKALNKTLSLNFQNVPLNDVAPVLAKELSINVLIDIKALIEEGIQPDDPVTLQLSQITARSALELMLRPLSLSFVSDNEVLLVTTISKENEKLVSRTYPVSDLIGQNKDYAALMQMLESTTSGPWMNRDGEGGTMTEFATAGSLVVRQTSRVQQQVLNLLRQQREAQQHMIPMKPGQPMPGRR